MTEEEVRGIFKLCGFKVNRLWQLQNQYWPSSYHELILNNPWWLIKTKYGSIHVGMRKRVYELSWDDTAHRGIITEDDVTKNETMVHAWSPAKLVEYLTTLREQLYKSGSVVEVGDRIRFQDSFVVEQMDDQGEYVIKPGSVWEIIKQISGDRYQLYHNEFNKEFIFDIYQKNFSVF